MNILVSNDDGIECPGLLTLVDQLSEIGDVYVVSPSVQQSAKSHAFTFKSVMQYEERTVPNAKKAYALWGTPVDCVHIGLEFLIKEKIDLVVSGINIGKNAGSDVIYSGTCGAAREGFLMGIPSIAMSYDDYSAKTYEEFENAAYVAKVVAKRYMESDFSKDYFLNVNVPKGDLDKTKGIRICNKYGQIVYGEQYTSFTEEGKTFIRIENGDHILKFDMNDYDIDAAAVKAGYITIAPLMVDQISKNSIEEVQCIFKDVNM